MSTSSDNLARVNILEGPCIDIPKNPIISFPFKLDDFQHHGINSIEAGHDILACIPTSGGKTLLGKYAVAHAVKAGKRAVYTTPIKALSFEKFRELCDEFAEICSVGLLNGDCKINPDSQCILCTAEILANSLFNLKNNVDNENKKLTQDFIDSIGVVVIDELHFMNDSTRGSVWENTLILLKDTPILGLSATIKNPENFCNWLSKSRNTIVDLIKVEKRLIPLKHYIYVYGKMFQFLNEHNEFSDEQYLLAKKRYDKGRDVLKQDLNKSLVLPKRTTFIENTTLVNDLVKDLTKEDLVDTGKNLLPSIVFSFSKANCEKFAKAVTINLIDHNERAEIEKIYNHYMHKVGNVYSDSISQVATIKDLILRGICFHHSGLMCILREIVEILFKKGLIKVLFATETLAIGVNCPVRSAIFIELEKYETGIGKRFITTAEYKQISGRSGRRNFDVNGNVIIMPYYSFPDMQDLKNVVLGSLPEIKSQLRPDYTFFLKMIQSNRMSLQEFYQRSLLYDEHQKELHGIRQELEIANRQESTLNAQIQSTNIDIKDLERLLELETQSTQTMGSFKISLSKPQQKELKKLEGIIKANKSLTDIRLTVRNKQKLHAEITRLESAEHALIGYMDYLSHKNIEMLTELGYVQDENVTVKGIIASHINECNSLLLTEVIVQDYLYGLEPREIVSLVSVFTEPIKSEVIDGVTRRGKGTPEINARLDRIESLAESFKSVEERIMGQTITDWSVSYSYTDIALMWADGASSAEISSILSNYKEHEGQFVKNMTRVYNIINDIKCICKMIGKIEILANLEIATTLILRDIVNANSLYLLS